MGIKGSNKSRTVQQGAGTQNIPNSCVLNHCLLITKNKERNRSRPGTQSSPPTSTCHVLQKGAGGVHPLLCLSGTAILAGHSRPTQPPPPDDTQALPLGRKPPLDASPPWTQGLRREVAPQQPAPTLQGTETTAVVQLRSPAQPPTGPVPATGSREGLCTPAGHWGGVDTRGWSQARLCNHSVWKGADRRAVQVTVTLHGLEGCGGKGGRKSTRRQERALSWESGNLALG